MAINEVPRGEVGSIYVSNFTQFDVYPSGNTKDFHQGFMSTGDVGYLDELPPSSTGKIVRRVLQDRAGRA
jgi:hypothetical protein